jgi:hypothetical protein
MVKSPTGRIEEAFSIDSGARGSDSEHAPMFLVRRIS